MEASGFRWPRRRLLTGAAAACATAWTPSSASAAGVDGHAVIQGSAGLSEITIVTTPRLAGAIHSLSWLGKEFIDSVDHGRQLQSALNCNAGSPLTAETFNPTEAGSRRDGAGGESTSRLLHLLADGSRLQTTTQMAFWLAPGERSGENLAKNQTALSNHLLTKRVVIGDGALSQVVRYDVTFSLPVNERHQQIVFEALTGYMPIDFSAFWRFDPNERRLMPLDDGPGEQRDPVVLATSRGEYAMGILAAPAACPGITGPTYGRFRFARERVNKWNCVFRLKDSSGIAPGDYSFSMRVLVGTRRDVESMLRDLIPAASS